MKELLVDLIDASAAKNPKLMLRRTESVVEKMLTNWMSICMYSCLRVSGDPWLSSCERASQSSWYAGALALIPFFTKCDGLVCPPLGLKSRKHWAVGVSGPGPL